MCEGLDLGPIMFPEKEDAYGFQLFCQKLAAKSFVIKNEQDRNKAVSLVSSFKQCGGKSFIDKYRLHVLLLNIY